MTKYQPADLATKEIYDQILATVGNGPAKSAGKVLLLYEEKITFIGDCCVRMNKLVHFRSFLQNASLHLNFTDRHNYELSEGLLKNNPNIDRLSLLPWTEIDFADYDLIFCIAYDEVRLLEYLAEKYGEGILSGRFRPMVYSISELLLIPRKESRCIFPFFNELMSYVTDSLPGELYISQDERDWGDQWLKARGLQPEEELLVMCDSSGGRDKLLSNTVYFDLLSSILDRPGVRVLVFDERNIGKEEFYRQWLGGRKARRIIVSKGMTLRQNLCLIASRHTKMVFGPCTGLMHCSSSIYNHFLRNGLDRSAVPVLITYTGTYSKENKGAYFWWGSSPLIRCLMLKERGGKPEMMLLSDLSVAEREKNDTLPCSFYTPEMLLDFINLSMYEKN
ncbi:MAG: hypothetical protein JST68_25985 [Bacteroidetes bacterium]|nr:hypothetical protein [Bacteroidota bacterium]